LIVAALSENELLSLAQRARELELDVLCEVHDENELQQALDAGCDSIGVNSRDLRNFRVDLDTLFRLAEQVPKNVFAVAESGIENATDLVRLRGAGYSAFLIGEALMKSPMPGVTLNALLAKAASVNSTAS
jgi:indole-3-glycerol phosphate synthase